MIGLGREGRSRPCAARGGASAAKSSGSAGRERAGPPSAFEATMGMAARASRRSPLSRLRRPAYFDAQGGAADADRPSGRPRRSLPEGGGGEIDLSQDAVRRSAVRSGRGDERDLVHVGHGRAAEQVAVVVGVPGKDHVYQLKRRRAGAAWSSQHPPPLSAMFNEGREPRLGSCNVTMAMRVSTQVGRGRPDGPQPDKRLSSKDSLGLAAGSLAVVSAIAWAAWH